MPQLWVVWVERDRKAGASWEVAAPLGPSSGSYLLSVEGRGSAGPARGKRARGTGVGVSRAGQGIPRGHGRSVLPQGTARVGTRHTRADVPAA